MPEASNFDLRKVTDVALTGVTTYDELNVPIAQRDRRFVELVAQTLASHPLGQEQDSGAYLRIFSPPIEGTDSHIAVKILRDDYTGYEIAKRQLEATDKKVLENYLHTNPHILLNGKERNVTFSALTEKEQIFVLLAYEHSLHEELYAPYVMPAVFVSFNSMEDVIDSSVIPYELRDWKEILKARQRLTPDGKEIIIKKGEIVFAMVQNFEVLSKSVFLMPRKDFSEDQLEQLTDFALRVQKVYEETGYYPDPSMNHPQAGNLKFLDDKLILIDTNSIRHENGNHNYRLGIVGRLLYIVDKARKAREAIK